MQLKSVPSLNILTSRKEGRISKILRRTYMIWAGFWWFAGFVVLFPFFTVCIWVPRFEPAMAFFNQIWCLLFFPLSFLRVRTFGKANIPSGQPVVYVSNHGSFLDIPLLTYVLPGFPAFMGKASLGRIPVFGFMFRNLHIVVERGSAQGRARAMKASRRKIQRGRSIVIFPEGSIHHKIQPGVADFKDGAFRLAIQAQTPIIPVTICHNWFILPDDGRWMPNLYFCKTIIHPPVFTEGMDESDSGILRDRIRIQIAEQLAFENQALLKKLTHEN